MEGGVSWGEEVGLVCGTGRSLTEAGVLYGGRGFMGEEVGLVCWAGMSLPEGVVL